MTVCHPHHNRFAAILKPSFLLKVNDPEKAFRMRRTIFEVAVAVAAAVIVLLVAAASGSLHGLLRWLLFVAVALVACGTAWLAARRVSPAQAVGVEVGNRITSEDTVTVQDISVGPSGENVSVGNDIHAKRGTLLHAITIGKVRGPSK